MTKQDDARKPGPDAAWGINAAARSNQQRVDYLGFDGSPIDTMRFDRLLRLLVLLPCLRILGISMCLGFSIIMADHTEDASRLQRDSRTAVVLFWITCALELFSASFSLLLAFYKNDVPFIEFVLSAYPRIALCIMCSWLCYPPRWWQQWIKLDIIFLAWVSTSIAFGFTVLEQASSTWRIHAIVLFPFTYGAIAGNLRVFVKWFPWTRKKLIVYKLIRIYHALLFTVTQSFGAHMDLGAIAYFSTALLMLRELFKHVAHREAELKHHFRELEEEKDSLLHKASQAAEAHAV